MFMYGGRNKDVASAVSNANLLLQNHEGFMDVISELEYTMTEVEGEDIVSFMKDRYMNSCQHVVVRYPWRFWSSALAWFSGKYPNNVTLNGRKIRRYNDTKMNVDSLTGSIIHEYVHLVDHFYQNARFGHGDNYGPGSFKKDSPMYIEKFNSAPYKIGRLAKECCQTSID